MILYIKVPTSKKNKNEKQNFIFSGGKESLTLHSLDSVIFPFLFM